MISYEVSIGSINDFIMKMAMEEVNSMHHLMSNLTLLGTCM